MRASRHGAVIGKDVTIGPYCVIEANVSIGDGCRLFSHVHITGHTTIGPRATIYPFASLGTPPQSVKYRGGPTKLTIGADCEIRESVTMNTGTEDAGGLTAVGDKCLFMVGTHVGHDCIVGNNVTMANNAALGGHCLVEDYVIFGGHSAVHQFVRIGEGAMIAGMTGIGADVIPFGFAIGQRGVLDGLNVVGLRRRGYSRFDIQRLAAGLSQPVHDAAAITRTASSRSRANMRPIRWWCKIVDFIRAGGPRPLMKSGQTAPAEAAMADGAAS